jgi:group I intron endonuclease
MIIYEIKNRINGKVYIGQHGSEDLGNYWGSGKLIKRAIEKYGIENFERSIIEKCSNKDELNEREKYWIKEKDTINKGYNLTDGGTGGDTSQFIDYSSNEWKEGQKNRAKNYWNNLSDEERKTRSQKVLGEKNGMFGKVGYWKDKNIPKEIIQKQLESRRSYEGSKNPNWKGGISMCYCKTCGIKISQNAEYCKDHIVYDRAKEKNAFYGKTHTEETKKQLSEKRMGKKPTNMRQVIINGVTYESVSEASRQTGIQSTTILWRINSKNKKFENYQSHQAIKAPLSN